MRFQKAIRLGLIALCMIAPCRAQHLETTGHQRFTLTYDYTSPGGSGRFYLPIPPPTGCQTIESFHSNWSGTTITNEPAQHLLAGRVPNSARAHWHIQITGTFTTHELAASNAPNPPTQPRPMQFDGASESLDWKSPAFQHWLDAHNFRRGQNERAVPFARRVYDYLTAHGRYVYPPSGGWTASGAARRLRTDCGGFSLVFVAACRANHIPARLLVGQWFKNASGSSRQAHVIAEFFDPAIGWIPADVSSALMHIGGRTDYFGREPGYFFAWHVDTDFHFDVPGHDNGHVQWIQNPAPYFNGGQAGSGSHHWTVTAD